MANLHLCILLVLPVLAAGSWTWNKWGSCSKTCGGMGTRTRNCKIIVSRSQSHASTSKCPPPQSEPCSSPTCPPGGAPGHVTWANWGAWSKCSAGPHCGTGQMNRTRTCKGVSSWVSQFARASTCPGVREEEKPCGTPCVGLPTNDWALWSACTKSCGGGTRKRVRTCKPGRQCRQPDLSEEGTCNPSSCPGWTSWSKWSGCIGAAQCKAGSKSRTRNCLGGMGAVKCVGEGREEEFCGGKCIGPDFNEWNSWMACSRQCGGGTQSRSRQCKPGRSCKPTDLNSEQKCNTGPCPKWANWGPWAACSKTCGPGQKKRTRSCQYGTTCPGLNYSTEPCNLRVCTSQAAPAPAKQHDPAPAHHDPAPAKHH